MHSKRRAKMKNEDGTAWAAILLLVLMLLLPFLWILVGTTTEPYHVVSGEPLREAAQAAGITVVSATDSTWPVAGAIGGKTYTLSDESGNLYTIRTQKFDSAESRDSAVIAYNAQSVGRGRPVGKLIVVGNYLVYVQPFTSAILKRIAPELQKLKAT
jgi:ABC-type glycerol-3-phosphate transport system permease component